ncbi:MAG: DedA family protein [Deltaproteobacteria bacterium]|jgi:membrane protein DedA with SNARE-associated domain|uniref:DedA family protein n=1 Tax=Candidatus Acidulodesulfobacterium acidiphilum TaxID=2597224 RepID=A0A520X9S8_9DELT|nr:DedA family protein [Deltaproteobacteria bacterium]MDA8298535.1 DedA family protein [Deltaproteobacteria bacterium]RZV37914.1 MAG: DedA family protein [Candidatus Acidulodesulfobacterium acidiphilum]
MNLNSLNKGYIGVFFSWALAAGLFYPGIIFLMFLESCAIPVSSEVVLMVSGFLSGEGKINFYLVVLSATVGTLAGSSLLYYIGKKGGRRIIEKYGKYFLVNKKDLEKAEVWFKKYGSITVFIGVCLPVIKTYIGFPPGASLMNYKKFAVYIVIGSLIYNAAVAYLGLVVGRNINLFIPYFKKFGIILIAAVIMLIVIYLYRHIKESR